jgi:hypothetical protein
MAVMNVFKTTTTAASPLDGSNSTADKPLVSDFITVQSFTNFAAMTGAITAAWHALQIVLPGAAALYVPYLFALAWGVVSFLISLEGLKTNGKYEAGTVGGAIFVAFINSLVLAGAVVGTNIATGKPT